jgi:hypothetical protein
MAAFEPDIAAFLLMLALLPPIVCALLALGISVVPYVETHETTARRSWLSTEGRCVPAADCGLGRMRVVVAGLLSSGEPCPPPGAFIHVTCNGRCIS